MAVSSPERQVLRFCRQYLQLEPEHLLSYPDDAQLREEHVQEIIFQKLFSEHATRRSPPAWYQLRVMKALVSRIENAVENWEVHGISDKIMDALAGLVAQPLPDEILAVQQRSYVTYHLHLLDRAAGTKESGRIKFNPHIAILESRSLVAAHGTTGLRTWEAALHLGQYLCDHRDLIAGKRVLELGAGTGYLSLLCAKHLGAQHVRVTDGDAGVFAALPESFLLNGLQDTAVIEAAELKWGQLLAGGEQLDCNLGKDIDLVIGADITFDPELIEPLVDTLGKLATEFPKVDILVAATERNRETFEGFLEVCRARRFAVVEEVFAVPRREEQEGPFYGNDVPIKICWVTRRKAFACRLSP